MACSLLISVGKARVGSSSLRPSLPEEEEGREEDEREEGREGGREEDEKGREEGEEEELRMRISRRRAVSCRLWERGMREGSLEEEEEKEERRCLALVSWER